MGILDDVAIEGVEGAVIVKGLVAIADFEQLLFCYGSANSSREFGCNFILKGVDVEIQVFFVSK